MCLIIIHEMGHFLCAIYLNIPVDKIYLYPFGGISKLKCQINIPLRKELLILIMGPLAQIVFATFLCKILPNEYQNIFLFYHFNILAFNLLPIYPLDGGKILNLLFAYHLSYRKSFYLSILISFVATLFFFFFLVKNRKLNIFLIFCLLLYKIHEEWTKRKFYQEKFLLERYLGIPSFKKRCQVNRVEDFKRDYQHIVKGKTRYYSEKEILSKKFKIKML